MIFDIETDALHIDDVTKIHCLAYYTGIDSLIKVTHDYDEMREILLSAPFLVGHNIILYDIPILEKMLCIKLPQQKIDTLALSWYLEPKRERHGLEMWGEFFGVKKPTIENWTSLTKEEYAHRCMEDVKINLRLWEHLQSKLGRLYEDKKLEKSLLAYLSFKMSCVALQHKSRWRLDRIKAEKLLESLSKEAEQKISELAAVMPNVPKYKIREPPAKPYKKSGDLSAAGLSWKLLLEEHNLPENHNQPVKYVGDWVAPNPGSSEQVKTWLFSMGWEPETFDYKKDEFGNERAIPQVRVEVDQVKVLCPSVLALAETHKEILILEGLTMLQHRIAILQGFLNNERDGFLIADIGGLTNTLRFKHRVLVNLPSIQRDYGKEIRGCLSAREGRVLCGSDMSSLEDNTKKHYMFSYDPEFVKEMSFEGFDPHLDLAVFAKTIKREDIDFYNSFKKSSKSAEFTPNTFDKERWKRIDAIRRQYKMANYACIYGVGPPKLARGLKTTKAKASKLIDVYWKRNWAVRKFSEDVEIKYIGDEMWVKNPVSKFYYSLRNKKDIFSTINQSTGVYLFDKWIGEFLSEREQLTAQFHDEVVLEIKEGSEQKARELLQKAISRVNSKTKLNITLSVDIQFGKSYADIH